MRGFVKFNWVWIKLFKSREIFNVFPALRVSIVPIPSSNEEIRLVDDAFGKISHMVSDGSWMVRVQAAKTLVRKSKRFSHYILYVGSVNFNSRCLMLASQGSMLQVSPHFLEQTLDKKLMSDLRVSTFRLVFCFHQNKSDVFVSFDLSVFRGSARLTNEPRSSSHPESSPLAGSGPMMPPKRNWTPTPSTSSPRGPAVLSSTASRTRCLVSVKSVCVFVRKFGPFLVLD